MILSYKDINDIAQGITASYSGEVFASVDIDYLILPNDIKDNNKKRHLGFKFYYGAEIEG